MFSLSVVSGMGIGNGDGDGDGRRTDQNAKKALDFVRSRGIRLTNIGKSDPLATPSIKVEGRGRGGLEERIAKEVLGLIRWGFFGGVGFV